jgi:hypothetical protein
MTKKDRNKPRLCREWTEEEYKAQAGWTIHFGPLLTVESLKKTEQQAPPKQQPKRRGAQ